MLRQLFPDLKAKTQLRWNGPKVVGQIRMGMRSRLKLAAQLLRDRVVVNLSVPVVKYKGPDGRTRVDPASRSKPGEYPRLDTAVLRNSVFWDMESETVARVGFSVDYGLYHELRERPFLRRTFNEQLPMLRKILLSGPKLPGS